jgi:hypothetical protein
VDHYDNGVAGSKEAPGCRTFEGDSVADAVLCGCSGCGGNGDQVNPAITSCGLGERDSDRQPTVATADHRHSLPGWRHGRLLGLVGDVQGVERVAGDFVHF